MYLASQQQPPVIRRNHVIVVHQSKSVTLKRSNLRATHPDVRPRDIVFSIRTPPKFGYFVLNQSLSGDDFVTSRVAVNVFSKFFEIQNNLTSEEKFRLFIRL